MDKSEKTLAILGLIVTAVIAVTGIYALSPYGFTVTAAYPELHVCILDGQYMFELPDMDSSSNPQIIMKDMINDGSSTRFKERISVVDNSWKIIGYPIKPYGKEVTLFIENGLPGVDVAFAQSQFGANFDENSNIIDVPPFNTDVIFEIGADSDLTYGTYYIIIKGTGQDKTEGICNLVLKVGQSCKQHKMFDVPLGSNNTIIVHSIIQ